MAKKNVNFLKTVDHTKTVYGRIMKATGLGGQSDFVKNAAILHDGISPEKMRHPEWIDRSFEAEAIITHNIKMFDQLLQDDILKPYRVIIEGMSAMMSERQTIMEDRKKILPSGKSIDIRVPVTVWVQVPDHATRRQASAKWFALTGHDPGMTKRLDIRATQNGIQVDIHSVYLSVMDGDNEELQLEAYNQAKRQERSGMLMLPDFKPNENPMDSGS